METNKDNKFKISLGDIALLVISIVFFIGMLSFLAPCGPKEDGSWMQCHYAGQMVMGLSIVMLVIAVIHIFIKDKKIKTGLSIAILPLAVLAIFVPGNMIGLCMMDTMRCHAVMQPGIIVLSVLMIIAALIDIFKNRKQ